MNARTWGALLLAACAPLAAAPQAVIAGRILDAATRRPIPATITIRTSDGAIVTEGAGLKTGFRCAGTFEKPVPPGEAVVTVNRGFDYAGVERKASPGPGERAELVFLLRRRTPLRRLGWYAGDNHAHMIHGERTLAVDFDSVALAGRAEGLDYMSVAQHWPVPHATPAVLTEACRRVSTPDFPLFWNMEMPKNFWRGDVSHSMGHGWTLGVRDTGAGGGNLIEELDALNAWDYESGKTPAPNFESHALIHAAGGLAAYTHPTTSWRGKWGGQGGFPVEEDKFISNLAQELPYDTVTGPTYDTLDVITSSARDTRPQQLWFMLLNHGYRIPGTASSDCTFDRPGGAVPGQARTYTRIEGGFSRDRIAAAMKAGRNIATSGPLILLEIGPHQIGDVVPVRGPRRFELRVRAWAAGTAGARLAKVEVIRNGEIVRAFAVEGGRTIFEMRFPITEKGTAWYVARAWGAAEGEAALTNPIYFEGPDYRPPQPARARVIAAIIDAATGAPLDGRCTIVTMQGGTPRTLRTEDFRSGRLALEVPGTARLTVQAPGYAPETKSIFMDSPELLDMALNMRAEQILNWETYEKIRSLLGEIKLDFRLRH
ncbi:MAG TPA: CehA/McbA family metallohydrolase [Bryobacteraceae bacterium]|nr:CehA/McbA family metallohydrolase [Bryobacteraceae bacterium]